MVLCVVNNSTTFFLTNHKILIRVKTLFCYCVYVVSVFVECFFCLILFMKNYVNDLCCSDSVTLGLRCFVVCIVLFKVDELFCFNYDYLFFLLLSMCNTYLNNFTF